MCSDPKFLAGADDILLQLRGIICVVLAACISINDLKPLIQQPHPRMLAWTGSRKLAKLWWNRCIISSWNSLK
ncbi:hypothetical protein SCLCIDRAFT_689176 [Scleroderma citrinum Foug A]|uniref:Uncharacterized protein n=1 Tax=Scleroderma citrinum Foug A TaxID=1036808 RepID=A0A0C3E5N1_9AGAM|nr:hypothetical protein SCLCIDRAFT_689176 [Scleroderma citrinum Foug A]